MSNQLLPCPFCGHDEPTHDEGDESAWVQCTNGECGMCGPMASGPSLAAAAWNRRATQPAAGEPVYQWHDETAWQECNSKREYLHAKDNGLRVRILWTSPPVACSEAVYQCRKRDGVWHDCSKHTYDSTFAGEEFEKRILWTVPTAAAHGASEAHRNDMADTIVSLRTEIAALRRNAAAHGDEIESLAVNRYRPTPDGLLHYKVVAGDGRRSLFTGTKAQCYLVAAKLTEAFLDGAYVQNSAAHGEDGRTCRFCQKRFDSAGECGNHVDQFHHGESEPVAHGDEAVLPERRPSTNGTWGDMGDAYSAGWNDCLDRVAAMRAQAGEGGEV